MSWLLVGLISLELLAGLAAMLVAVLVGLIYTTVLCCVGGVVVDGNVIVEVEGASWLLVGLVSLELLAGLVAVLVNQGSQLQCRLV